MAVPAASNAYTSPKVQGANNGDAQVVKSGGAIVIEAGGALWMAGKQFNAVAGQQTTVAAVDTVVTGLQTVVSVVASLDSDPGDDPEWVTASIGDQAGSPAAGSILVKTWKNTGGTDPTPVAATTFGKKVNWIAVGT
jgi:hypothetical protein